METAMTTLDERCIRDYPSLFTKGECDVCGGTAARGVHNVGNSTECDPCNTASEATYAAQGGQ